MAVYSIDIDYRVFISVPILTLVSFLQALQYGNYLKCPSLVQTNVIKHASSYKTVETGQRNSWFNLVVFLGGS